MERCSSGSCFLWLFQVSSKYFTDVLKLICSSSQAPRIVTNSSLRTFTSPMLLILCLILIYNITTALLPLVKTKDDLSDIPLTPTQRALLGLDPNATPPLTPGTQYITPPRYPRSPTPRNISPASRSISNTPQSRKGSPSFGRESSDSPSPLWQKTIGNGRDTLRRNSYGSPSPLGPGNNDRSILGAPNTPSPATGRGPTVGLNNKWLFDKGRASSGGRSIYQ